MPIDRRRDKEVVVHIYNGILLSHKMERNWVICRDVDGSRDCHTEWSKSDREIQLSFINTYMWNLEKWYRWTALQDRKWDTDVENKRMDTKGGKWWGGWWCDELGDWIDIYTLICIKWITNKNLLYKKINKIKFTNSNKKSKIWSWQVLATFWKLSVVFNEVDFPLASLLLTVSLSWEF